MQKAIPLLLLSLALAACGGAPTPPVTTPGPGPAPTDQIAPTITLTATPNPVTLPADVTLEAAAQDNVGVTKVAFYQGETLLGEDTEAPFTWQVRVEEGSGTAFKAIAFDAAGNSASAETSIEVTPPREMGTLAFDLVTSNRGAAVAGSTVNVYAAGSSKLLASGATNAEGYAEFNLPAGEYDAAFNQEGYAASAIYGAVSRPGQMSRHKVAQYKTHNKYGDAAPPRLIIETPAGPVPESGEVESWQPLTAGQTFNGAVQLRAYTDPSQPAPLLMKYLMFSLVSFEGGEMLEKRVDLSQQDAGRVQPGLEQSSGLVELLPSGLSGDIYLQVSALDFNNNRSAYLIPVHLEAESGAAEMPAPTDVRAVSYTNTQPVDYIYSLKPQAAASGTNLWVNVSWKMPPEAEVSRYRLLRAESPEGPYQAVAFAGAEACKVGTCKLSDNTATLRPSQDYYYRVAAQGGAETLSEAPQQPSTHTMPAFQPQLLSPGAEATGVDWLPTYTVKTNLEAAEAHGARFDLVVADVFTGRRTMAAPPLWLERRADGTTVRGVGNDSERFYLNGDKVALVQYDAISDILSVPHDLSRLRYNLNPTPLQSNRRYSWMLDGAFAFRLADPASPFSETNPVVAYSVYSDANSEKIVPDGARQSAAEIHHFITKP